MKGTIEGHLYSLISYYTPNKGQAAFLKHLFDTISPALESTVIFGGGSNAAFNQGLDRTKPPSTQLTRPTKESLKIAKLIHAQGLDDVWRELNPTKQHYTHFSHPHNSYARIDHLLVLTNTNPLVVKSLIRDTVLSDHSIVIMSIQLQGSSPGQRHWRLNDSSRSDPVRVFMLDKSLREYFIFNNVEKMSSETLWVAHKTYIRGKIIRMADQIKREGEADILWLEGVYSQLRAQHKLNPSPDTVVQLDTARLELNLALTAKVKSQI